MSAPEPSTDPALLVDDLVVGFGRRAPVLHGVSLRIEPGERLGLIGESGSGKSVTALAAMGLLPEQAYATGSVTVCGTPVLGRPDRMLARLRGDTVSMVFQEPMTALDPTMKVGRQVAEVLMLHPRRAPGGPQLARQRVLEMLGEVGLPDPPRVAESYPHQLSGGQRQRVMMAMALINTPQLIICDEPTTALDVTVQAKVLALLDQELTQRGAACLFISHDLAVVSQICSAVAVMYDGVVVESGPLDQVLSAPEHPYTAGLVATARLDQVPPGERLPTVEDFWPLADRPSVPTEQRS
ncbi:ABC transporter ATP-binding protein [Microlunatus sp. Y2014]|uniref:ABC transporter ATP-binding protein n=1 Tax=Microlunatus sp. Y2014 TaxID=3418488 RepID=UPI003DA77AED